MDNNKIFDLLEKVYLEVQEVKADMKEVKSDLKDLKGQVLRMEDNHSKKLEALFDGYKQNTELIEAVKLEVEKHEEVILKRVK